MKVSKAKSSIRQFKPDSLGYLCSADDSLFEVVGDSLISTKLMAGLASALEGKIDQSFTVLSIPGLAGHAYWDALDDTEREVVGACIVKLIETKRVRLLPDTTVY